MEKLKCAQCEGKFQISVKLFRELTKWIDNNGLFGNNTLYALDDLHACCKKPNHYWVFRGTADDNGKFIGITKTVRTAYKIVKNQND